MIAYFIGGVSENEYKEKSQGDDGCEAAAFMNFSAPRNNTT